MFWSKAIGEQVRMFDIVFRKLLDPPGYSSLGLHNQLCVNFIECLALF